MTVKREKKQKVILRLYFFFPEEGPLTLLSWAEANEIWNCHPLKVKLTVVESQPSGIRGRKVKNLSVVWAT